MKAKQKVKKLLSNHQHFRDSDNKLIAAYWYNEIKGKGLNPNEMTGMDLLHYFADCKLTNPETIRRSRAKIQEENPNLRGNNYTARKGVIQKQWRKDLGYESGN